MSSLSGREQAGRRSRVNRVEALLKPPMRKLETTNRRLNIGFAYSGARWNNEEELKKIAANHPDDLKVI
jgi:hypothetical protein